MEFVAIGDEIWRVHSVWQCAGDPDPCVIHSPSDHHLRAWPMHLRETGLVERTCEHGVGHPDPDSAAYFNRLYRHKRGTWETHGCDGCCWERLDDADNA